ncbi:MAG: hypothetical protein JSS09_06970, partial [Verrucomicrobia bacterium]|nr:hypothetical protein [Verrucomicrobiota bacterium]
MISLPGSINLSVKANTCNCFREPTISNNARVFPRGEDNESTLFQKIFFPAKIQEQNQRAKDTLAKYLTRKLDHPTAQTLISDLNENTKPLLVKDA